jgi:hypothetical protein
MDIDEYEIAWHNAISNLTDLELKQFFGCGWLEILVNEKWKPLLKLPTSYMLSLTPTWM